jgi:predicted PurR-regulated permease PerM
VALADEATMAPDRPSSGVAAAALRVALVVAAVIFVVYLAWHLRQLLLLIFLALLVAAALHSPSERLERLGIPRLGAVLGVYAALLVVLTLAVLLVVPPLVREIASFVERVPELVEELRESVIGIVDGIAPGNGERAIDTLTGGLAGVDWGPLLQVPLTVAEFVISLLLVLVLSAFMLLERDRARRYSLRFFEERRGQRLLELTHTALGKLGAYVRGQLLVMFLVGVGTTIGLVLLGVPFALPLGVFAFIAEAVPFAGPWVAGIPIVLIAALESPLTGLLVAVWFIILQQLEGFVITPLVQGHVVRVSPMVVLLAVLAGALLGGIVGAIIAIPIVAVIDVLIEEVILPLRQRQQDGLPHPSDPLEESPSGA